MLCCVWHADCVLTGMRQVAYVDRAAELLASGPSLSPQAGLLLHNLLSMPSHPSSLKTKLEDHRHVVSIFMFASKRG